MTMLASYEYATHTIRFHFNMKEPARATNGLSQKDGTDLSETDFQWNTHLDMRHDADKAMVNAKKE